MNPQRDGKAPRPSRRTWWRGSRPGPRGSCRAPGRRAAGGVRTAPGSSSARTWRARAGLRPEERERAAGPGPGPGCRQAHVIEEARDVGVARVHVVPEVAQPAAPEVVRDQAGLPAPGGPVTHVSGPRRPRSSIRNRRGRPTMPRRLGGVIFASADRSRLIACPGRGAATAYAEAGGRFQPLIRRAARAGPAARACALRRLDTSRKRFLHSPESCRRSMAPPRGACQDLRDPDSRRTPWSGGSSSSTGSSACRTLRRRRCRACARPISTGRPVPAVTPSAGPSGISRASRTGRSPT